MHDEAADSGISRRELLGTMGKVAAASVVAAPLLEGVVGIPVEIVAQAPPLNAIAGADRTTVLPGRTYLNAWAGYGEPPRRERRRNVPATPPPPAPRPRANGRVEKGIRPRRGDLRRRQRAGDHRHVLGSGRLCPEADGRQRAGDRRLHVECHGGTRAADQQLEAVYTKTSRSTVRCGTAAPRP